jgi:transcriptional regulator with XRE-family HTH domain
MAKVHGPRIRAARAYAGISTAELATRLGVSDSTVKRWERGDPSLTPGYRLAIAGFCGVPAEFMENGWGILEAGRVEELLDKQTKILEEIKDAIAEQKQLKADTDGILPLIRELVRPEASAARSQAQKPNTPLET